MLRELMQLYDKRFIGHVKNMWFRRVLDEDGKENLNS